MAKADALARRFRADAQDHPQADRLFAQLSAHYSEPHRHYHTLDHLAALFALFDEHRGRLSDVRSVSFAIWYHDVIYDTRSGDNEEQSAALAAEALRSLGDEPIDRVTHMILATKNHTAEPANADEALFLDMDFSILGASPARYAAYVDEVRAEYDWLPDEGWRAGRLAFLTKAEAAPRLFHTALFEAAMGARARANIAWEMGRLRA